MVLNKVLMNNAALLFKTSTTRPLVEKDGGYVEVVDLDMSRGATTGCLSPLQKFRAACCRCCGHRG